MTIFGLADDVWILPETFSFFSRCWQILAMSCVLSQTTIELGITEIIFILSCAIVFYLHCLEFNGPLQDNIFVQAGAGCIGIIGTFVLLANSNLDNLNPEIYIAKYYAGIFAALGVVSSIITGSDFYLHLRFNSPQSKN